MSRVLMWFTAIIFAILIAVGGLFYIARTHDGPMEIISGGPFQTGETITDVEDWSFLDQHMTIELQTMLPPRSRTMWLVVVDNRPFVISSYMNSRVGRMWKKWPHTVEEDNRAIIRVDGNLYEMKLARLLDGDMIEPVLQQFNAKYRGKHTMEEVQSGNSWLFELKGR